MESFEDGRWQMPVRYLICASLTLSKNSSREVVARQFFVYDGMAEDCVWNTASKKSRNADR